MNDAVREIVTSDADDEGEGGDSEASVGLAKLLKHARDWNTNSRSSRVAQVCSFLHANYPFRLHRRMHTCNLLAGGDAVTVEDDDGFTRRVPNSFVVISERGQC